MRGLLVLVVSGCAGVAAAPAPPPAAVEHTLGTPFAVPGETMIFEVSLRGMRVGRVEVGVGQPGWVEGKHAIIVKSHGETEGLVSLLGDLDWTLETTIDLETGRPIASVEDAAITFRGKTETEHDASTDDTHDVHSSIVALRGWRSAPNQKTTLELEIADASIDLALHEGGHDWIDRPAVRYDGVAFGKWPFKIWLSDDTARVPLRMETSTKWGRIGVELVEYTAPRDL